MRNRVNEVELSVVIDGVTHPMRRCAWLWIDPVGHVYGSVSADTVLTADAAHAEFESDRRDRERQLNWGFTLELIPLSSFGERARPCLIGECDHEPPPGLKTCKLCGRIGRGDFHTVLDERGKALLRCRARRSCDRRRLIRYGSPSR